MRCLDFDKFALKFAEIKDKVYGLHLFQNDTGVLHKRFVQKYPVEINVLETEDSITIYKSGYQSIEAHGLGFKCQAVIDTAYGSKLRVTDLYNKTDDGQLEVSRNIDVIKSSTNDKGFFSVFSLFWSEPTCLSDNEYFIPGVWYGDNQNAPSYAVGGNYSDKMFSIRESRAAAPGLMARSKQDGYSLVISNAKPDANTIEEDVSDKDILIDRRFRFASLGIDQRSQLRLMFCYPGVEGERSYSRIGGEDVKRTLFRFHPISRDLKHEYTMNINLVHYNDFYSGLRSTWRQWYEYYEPPIIKNGNLEQIEREIYDLFNSVWVENNEVTGIPLITDLITDQQLKRYEFGFTGSQILLAYYLIKYGLEQENTDAVQKGEKTVNWWINNASTESGLSHTLYEEGVGWIDESGKNVVMTRTLIDGFTAALRILELYDKHGIQRREYLDWCLKFGEWLLDNQNPDGSFYRQYDVCTNEPKEYSKGITAFSIPFLVSLFQRTDEQKYLDAAITAAEFSFENFTLTNEYYGGTPNNPNCSDKEASLFTLRAFLTLFKETGEQKWLEAAERAGTIGETWNYIWNVPIINGNKDTHWKQGISTVGVSIVTLGYSAVDYFNAYFAQDYYELYKLTGDKHYGHVASICLHNSKHLTNIDGYLGSIHPAYQSEHWIIGMPSGYSHFENPSWLPWVSLAHLDSLNGTSELL